MNIYTSYWEGDEVLSQKLFSFNVIYINYSELKKLKGREL